MSIADITGLLTAIGVVLTGLGTLRNARKVDAVHQELRTTNGHTVGALVEQNLPPSFGEQVATEGAREDQTSVANPNPAVTQPPT